jgi:hypothetical protein
MQAETAILDHTVHTRFSNDSIKDTGRFSCETTAVLHTWQRKRGRSHVQRQGASRLGEGSAAYSLAAQDVPAIETGYQKGMSRCTTATTSLTPLKQTDNSQKYIRAIAS